MIQCSKWGWGKTNIHKYYYDLSWFERRAVICILLYFHCKTIWWKPLLIAHILLQLRPLLPFTGSPSPAFIRDQLHAFDLPLDMLTTVVTWENVIPPDDTMDDDNVWRDSLTYKSNMLLLPSSCNSVLPPPLNDNRIPPDSQCVEKVLENRNNLSLTPQYWSVERI